MDLFFSLIRLLFANLYLFCSLVVSVFHPILTDTGYNPIPPPTETLRPSTFDPHTFGLALGNCAHSNQNSFVSGGDDGSPIVMLADGSRV